MAELEQTQEAPKEQLQEGQADGATQAEERATEQKPVNLDELPEFRQWKSTMDRKLSQEQQERERLKTELEEHRKKVDELSLRDAPPEERERYLRNKITQLEEERRLQTERQQQVKQATDRAEAFLESMGLSTDTPGLDWSGDPMGDGFEKLALSAAKLASSRTDKTKEQVEAEKRQAEQEALRKTGAARVSTATSEGDSDLARAYRKELGELGTGNFRAYADLRQRYRDKGLPI